MVKTDKTIGRRIEIQAQTIGAILAGILADSAQQDDYPAFNQRRSTVTKNALAV